MEQFFKALEDGKLIRFNNMDEFEDCVKLLSGTDYIWLEGISMADTTDCMLEYIRANMETPMHAYIRTFRQTQYLVFGDTTQERIDCYGSYEYSQLPMCKFKY